MFLLHRDRIRKVGAEDIKRVAAAYLKRRIVRSGLFIPTEKPDARRNSCRERRRRSRAMVKDYKGETAVATAKRSIRRRKNIEARTLAARSAI